MHNACLTAVACAASEATLVVASLLSLLLLLDGCHLNEAGGSGYACGNRGKHHVGRIRHTLHGGAVGGDGRDGGLRDGLGNLHGSLLARVLGLNLGHLLLLLFFELLCLGSVVASSGDKLLILLLGDVDLIVGLRGIVGRHGTHERRDGIHSRLHLRHDAVAHLGSGVAHGSHCLLMGHKALPLHRLDVGESGLVDVDVGSDERGDALPRGMAVGILCLGIVGCSVVCRLRIGAELLATGVLEFVGRLLLGIVEADLMEHLLVFLLLEKSFFV